MAKAPLYPYGCGRHQGSINMLLAKYPGIMRDILVSHVMKGTSCTNIFLYSDTLKLSYRIFWISAEKHSPYHRIKKWVRLEESSGGYLVTSVRKRPRSSLDHRPAIRPLKLREWMVLRWQYQLKKWTKEMSRSRIPCSENRYKQNLSWCCTRRAGFSGTQIWCHEKRVGCDLPCIPSPPERNWGMPRFCKGLRDGKNSTLPLQSKVYCFLSEPFRSSQNNKR